ncbi:RNA polymerase sigma-70 factor [Danxiaibacter flavus]|uniref:RNA polymerase sigma-70 factor n=1 Tax=Danxiaibacter flavus TaxID=3049108 RepID=A0ABV3ZA81_9BACT|nr:RNA polymerase sigma-70 factor [Chitinophagaceae bacterium DXS]
MTENNTPQLLFQQLANGDQRSLEMLYKMYYSRLTGFVTGFVKNKESAEEVVSDVFVSIWQQREKLPSIEHPSTYLFTCARNAALNYIRKFGNSRVVFMEDSGCAVLTENTDPSKELEKKELMIKMDRAIESLPLQCKTIFRLVKEQGFKCREVAEIMNLSTRTVETQVYKAVKKLDEVLSERHTSSNKPSNKGSFFSLLFFFSFF